MSGLKLFIICILVKNIVHGSLQDAMSPYIKRINYLSMKSLLVMSFTLFSLLVSAQETTITILEEGEITYKNYEGQGSKKVIELSGNDSSSLELKIYEKSYLYGIRSEAEIVLSGDNIYLLEKFVDKYLEWKKLELQKKTKIEKEMFNKKGMDRIRASGKSDSDYSEYGSNIDSQDCYKYKRSLSVKYIGDLTDLPLDTEPYLTIQYSCDGLDIVSISLFESALEKLKAYFSSGQFNEAIDTIINSHKTWDEFEPIDD